MGTRTPYHAWWSPTRAANGTRRAARLCGAAAATRLPDIMVTPVTLAGSAEIIAAARAALGGATFNVLWAAGHAMAPAEAIAEAVKDGADI